MAKYRTPKTCVLGLCFESLMTRQHNQDLCREDLCAWAGDVKQGGSRQRHRGPPNKISNQHRHHMQLLTCICRKHGLPCPLASTASIVTSNTVLPAQVQRECWPGCAMGIRGPPRGILPPRILQEGLNYLIPLVVTLDIESPHAGPLCLERSACEIGVVCSARQPASSDPGRHPTCCHLSV